MGLFTRRMESDERPDADGRLAELKGAVEKAELPEPALRAARRELERLEKTDPGVAEHAIGLNYVDFILSLPWNAQAQDNLDLGRAERILEEGHHGLEHVKERVLERLAAGVMRSRRPARLLVVEDETIALENLVHVLGKAGHEVHAAASGLAALERLAERPFDLVVSDLKMEGLDGLGLLAQAKERQPGLEFILVTGYATVETAVTALQGGAAHYLPKPLNLDVLRRTVGSVLARKTQALAVQGPTLCFAGPPGTGKTSIGRSIAEAMGRPFIRLSMAGLRDEAELRGHRRTYVGALPGRILGEIRTAGARNPVIALDEVDKIGQDVRGDPASVLLELLDPEQNGRFVDAYLDVPFDLSRVMFLATANLVERLPAPLIDRMEIVQFPSYALGEKRRIARARLLPRQAKAAGLDPDQIDLTDEALTRLISGYTREAGVRGLDRELGSLCRKAARELLTGEARTVRLDPARLETLLGPERFAREAAQAPALAGVTTGMVWTEYGGEIIFIETARMKGASRLLMTGSLGEVLKESAQTALSFIRSRAGDYGIDPDFFATSDIHIHIPAGAIPKDGPSAGLTIALALLSLLTNRPARRDAALSGELTLSGQLLPVSGVREKILAAQQAGARVAVFPARCEPAVRALDEETRQALDIVLAHGVDEAAAVVLA